MNVNYLLFQNIFLYVMNVIHLLFLKYVCVEGCVPHASRVLCVLSGKCLSSNPGWTNSSPLQHNGRPPGGGEIPAAIRSRPHNQRQGGIQSSHPSYGRATTVETG